MKLRKLPTLLAIVITIMGLAAGVFLIKQVQNFKKQASGEALPKSIKITNIDSSTFVVSWQTVDKAAGAIEYGETSALGEIQKDNRDKMGGSENQFINHFVTIDNLKPSTKYFFRILSSGKTYDNSGKPYEVTTALAKSPIDNDIAQGKILTSNNLPANGALVYLSLANTITQAALTNNNGHWMIPLSTARSIDLQNYSSYDRKAQIEEIAVQGENQTAYAILTTDNDNPTYDITLGQNYNFLDQMPSPQATTAVIKKGTLPGSAGFSNSSNETELKIVFPSENEEVNSLNPEFIGTGPKDKKLDILVESEQTITDQIQTTKDSNWSWSPKTPLTPGEHKIIVSYTDKEGFVKKISRTFVVLAAGQSDLPSFTATASGQRLTPTPLPLPSPTIKPLTPTPTIKTARTTVPKVSSDESPTSGEILPTKLFFGAGIITVIVGIALILL